MLFLFKSFNVFSFLKVRASAVDACKRLGRYRMPFCWTAIELAKIFRGLPLDTGIDLLKLDILILCFSCRDASRNSKKLIYLNVQQGKYIWKISILLNIARYLDIQGLRNFFFWLLGGQKHSIDQNLEFNKNLRGSAENWLVWQIMHRLHRDFYHFITKVSETNRTSPPGRLSC